MRHLQSFSIGILIFLAPFARGGTEVQRKEILTHLETQLNEFRIFYQEEDEWIDQTLVPLTAELLSTQKQLEDARLEMDSWGDVDILQRDLPQLPETRARRLSADLEDRFLWLYLTDLNLRLAAAKHLDLMKEISTYVGQVGGLYDDVQSKLKIILAIYREDEKLTDLPSAVKSGQEALALIRKQREPDDRQEYRESIRGINDLLSRAKLSRSRTLWLDALETYISITRNPRLARVNPAELRITQISIYASQITIDEAKSTLLSRFKKLHLNQSPAAERIRRYFETFERDPVPDDTRFERAELLLNQAELHFACRQSEHRFFKSDIRLCSNDEGEDEEGDEDGESSETVTSGLHAQTETRMVDGHPVDMVTVTAFVADSTGRKDTAGTSVRADSIEAARIRNYFNVPDGQKSFDKGKTETHSESRPAPAGSEFGFSYSDLSRVQTTISQSDTATAHVNNVHISEPITPDHYRVERDYLYSPLELNSRAEMGYGTKDFAEKMRDIDPTLAKRSEAVAQEIRAGEINLRARFSAVTNGLRNQMLPSTCPVSDENAGFSGQNPESRNVQKNIESAQNVLATLRAKLSQGNHPDRERVATGLSATNQLLTSAHEALRAGDSSNASKLLEMGLEFVAKYGPMALRISVDITPASRFAALAELLTAKDVVTNEDIGLSGRMFAAMSLVAGDRTFWASVIRYFDGESSLAIEESVSRTIRVIQSYDKKNPGPLHLSDKIKGLNLFGNANYALVEFEQNDEVCQIVSPGETPGPLWTLAPPEDPGSPNSKGKDPDPIGFVRLKIPSGSRVYLGSETLSENIAPAGSLPVYIPAELLQKLLKK